jgi:hypothetical protein
MPKRIIGKLPVNVKYKINSINYLPCECATVCDNCGKIISNIANISNENGKTFSVGLDCADTMSCYNNNEEHQLLEHKKILARRAKFVKWFKTEYKSHFIRDNNIWFYKSMQTEWQSFWTYRMPLDFFRNTYPYLQLLALDNAETLC